MLTRNLYISTLLLTIISLGRANAQHFAIESSIIYSTKESVSKEHVSEDTTTLYHVRDIVITGNKRTRERIILRELPFDIGEQYELHELIGKFNRAKKQLMNTSLFTEVEVSLRSVDNKDATILVVVTERAYFYPIPFAKVVDRDIQDWISNQGMDLHRVNYGIKLKHKNITGLNDRLNLNITNGFTKELAIRYDGFPIDNQLKWFGNFYVAKGQNRSITYKTENNKQVGYRNDNDYLYTYFKSGVAVSFRPAIRVRHNFGVGYSQEKFFDSLSKMNAMFSYENKYIRYPEFFYRFDFANVDFLPYPTKGHIANISLTRKGFNSPINVWELSARTSSSWPVTHTSFFNLRATGILKAPFDQPYMMKGFVNGGTYIQGYEDYVIDGVAGGFTKATFTKNIFNRKYSIPSNRIERLNHIPVKVYAKVFTNAGYIYNADPGTNTLNNRFLYSGGVGVDIVLFYDLVFRIEWSVNHLRQNGIYLHDRRYL